MVFRFHCRQNILLWAFSWTVNTISGAVHKVSEPLSLVLQREKKKQILLYFPFPERSEVHSGLCSLVFKLGTVFFDDTESNFFLSILLVMRSQSGISVFSGSFWISLFFVMYSPPFFHCWTALTGTNQLWKKWIFLNSSQCYLLASGNEAFWKNLNTALEIIGQRAETRRIKCWKLPNE